MRASELARQVLLAVVVLTGLVTGRNVAVLALLSVPLISAAVTACLFTWEVSQATATACNDHELAAVAGALAAQGWTVSDTDPGAHCRPTRVGSHCSRMP